jgi:hypothetical protein
MERTAEHATQFHLSPVGWREEAEEPQLQSIFSPSYQFFFPEHLLSTQWPCEEG